MEYAAQEEDGTECTDIRLRRKEKIVKQNANQSVAHNFGLVYLKCSGHCIESSGPAAAPSTTITQKYHYRVDILPKPVKVTKNHVKERATEI